MFNYVTKARHFSRVFSTDAGSKQQVPVALQSHHFNSGGRAGVSRLDFLNDRQYRALFHVLYGDSYFFHSWHSVPMFHLLLN